MAKKEKEVKEKTKKQKSHYFKDMKAELKKVIWPTPKQLASNTFGVIAFTLIIAAVVLVLDLCFRAINNGVLTAQEKIQSSYSSSTENDNESTENEENSDSSEDEKSEIKVEADSEDSESKE